LSATLTTNTWASGLTFTASTTYADLLSSQSTPNVVSGKSHCARECLIKAGGGTANLHHGAWIFASATNLPVKLNTNAANTLLADTTTNAASPVDLGTTHCTGF